MDLKKKIRNIPNFPEKGIVFRDIGPLLEDKKAFRSMVLQLVKKMGKLKVDKVVGIDARGFILAGVLAHELQAGMVMVRKKGKLPFKTESMECDLEYGKAILEIHQDSIKEGEKVLLVDDVLATGGTMFAAAKLVEKLKGKIEGIAFLVALDYLPGREKLKNYQVFSLINYNRFAKTSHFSAGDEGKARFQASLGANSKAVESLPEKTLGFQPREAYKK